ncbi:MAG: SDR family NAD(P)-dependent oxidoreductase [Flavobacteriales bacterium]|nr:SDR family NAD(P)-dependent oxidoreductase [Flavobacteriales bacterium]
MNKKALVTGATSGFGRAISLTLAKAGYDLIITGRRQNLLDEVKQEIQSMNSKCLDLCFDVRESKATQEALMLPEDWQSIDVLVNNAGLALGKEPIAIAKEKDWDQMLDTNVKGLLRVSKAITPYLNEGGTVINIGSIAGKEVYPGGNVYCASKHAVDAITKALRMELAPKKIRVSQIAPGAANTEFSKVRFKGNQEKADAVYHGFEELSAQDIADVALFMVSRPPHVCLNDVIIMPTAQPNSHQIIRS